MCVDIVLGSPWPNGNAMAGPVSNFSSGAVWREMQGGPRQRQPPPGLRQSHSHMNCYIKFENVFTLTRYCLSQTVTSSW